MGSYPRKARPMTPANASKLRSRNKPWIAGLHDFIEALPRLNVIDRVESIIGQRRNVEVFARTRVSLGCRQYSGAALHCPCDQHLRRRLSNSLGNPQDNRIFEWSGPYAMPQWRKRQKDDVVLLAELQKFSFRKIRMSLDLNDRRLDSRSFIQRLELIQTNVGKADRAALFTIDKIFHGPPCVE